MAPDVAPALVVPDATDPDLLGRVTLVIPTFRRPDRARRALRFWAGRGVRVLMLDGSDRPLDLPAEAAADPGLTYLHRPEPLAQRFAFAVGAVQTEFVSLCGDDDFLLPGALAASARFLDHSPDYVACGGQALGFDRGPLGGLRAFQRYPQFRGLDLHGPRPRDRAVQHFASYSPATVYALCRAEAWRAAMRIWSDKEFPVYAIGEVQFEFLMAAMGGIRRLPVLHWLRSHERVAKAHDRAKGGDASLSRALQVPEVWADPAHAALKAEITARTAAHVAAATGLSQAEAAADFEAAMAAYLAPRPKPGRLQRRLERLRLPLGLRLLQMRGQGITWAPADLAAVRMALAQR